jgi:hypothetical protein
MSTRQYWSCIFLLTFHGLACQATRETYLLHNGVSVSSNIVKRHREIDVKTQHTESVHSSAAAVAKVKAQQRYYTYTQPMSSIYVALLSRQAAGVLLHCPEQPQTLKVACIHHNTPAALQSAVWRGGDKYAASRGTPKGVHGAADTYLAIVDVATAGI